MTAGLGETVVADNFVPEENTNIFIESHDSLSFFTFIYWKWKNYYVCYKYGAEMQ